MFNELDTAPNALPEARSPDCMFADDADAAAFARISNEAKDEVRFKWRLMWRFQAMKTRMGVEPAAESLALSVSKPGYSAKSLIRCFYDWRKAKDWRALCPDYELDDDDCPLTVHRDTIEHFRALCDKFHRGVAAAWRELIRQWKSWCEGWGAPIPGCKDCPPPGPRGDFPAGWSKRNWYRHKPTPFEDAAAHEGRQAAAQFRPLVKRSKAGLEPGQVFFFDDHEHNQLINLLGKNSRATRPHELACQDCATGAIVLNLFKPAIWHDDIQKKEVLRGINARWMFAHWLTTVGWRADIGTTLVCEWGTMAASTRIEQRISELTRGMVRIQRGGIHRAPAHAGQFHGAARGNFRMKSPLESTFNLIDNEFSGLLGQTGKDRRPPEELDGRTAYNAKLLAAAETSAELARELRYPFMPWAEWLRHALEFYRRINHRRDHELQGYEENGWTTLDWRPADGLPWLPASALAAMDPDARVAMLAMLEKNPRLRLPRVMTPWEVWVPASVKLTRAPGHFIPLLLEGEGARPLTVEDDHTFEFSDSDLGPGEFSFPAKLHGEWLRPREKYLTYCNPFDTGTLYVCDQKGRFLGECKAEAAPGWCDDEAMKAAVIRAAKHEAELLAPLVRRGRAQVRERIELHRHNGRAVKRAARAEAPASPPAGKTSRADVLRRAREDAELAATLIAET